MSYNEALKNLEKLRWYVNEALSDLNTYDTMCVSDTGDEYGSERFPTEVEFELLRERIVDSLNHAKMYDELVKRDLIDGYNDIRHDLGRAIKTAERLSITSD